MVILMDSENTDIKDISIHEDVAYGTMKFVANHTIVLEKLDWYQAYYYNEDIKITILSDANYSGKLLYSLIVFGLPSVVQAATFVFLPSRVSENSRYGAGFGVFILGIISVDYCKSVAYVLSAGHITLVFDY